MSDTSDETVVAPERRDKGKRGNPISRAAVYNRQVWAEMAKVVWPTRQQLLTYTAVVIVFVCVVMAFVSALDFVFGKLAFWIFA